MRRSVAPTVALLITGTMIAASCGGGDDDTSSATDPTAADTSPATDPPATDPPATDPPATDPPATDPPATDPPAAPGDDGVLDVPAEFATIQEAVDAASEGDLVLIAPGTYVEAVDVTTDHLTIRGLDRDGVVLDGQLELDNGIRVLGASGVAIENLTAVNYTNNGLFWVSSTGLSRLVHQRPTAPATTASTRSTRSADRSSTHTRSAAAMPASTSASAIPATRSSTR